MPPPLCPQAPHGQASGNNEPSTWSSQGPRPVPLEDDGVRAAFEPKEPTQPTMSSQESKISTLMTCGQAKRQGSPSVELPPMKIMKREQTSQFEKTDSPTKILGKVEQSIATSSAEPSPVDQLKKESVPIGGQADYLAKLRSELETAVQPNVPIEYPEWWHNVKKSLDDRVAVALQDVANFYQMTRDVIQLRGTLAMESISDWHASNEVKIPAQQTALFSPASNSRLVNSKCERTEKTLEAERVKHQSQLEDLRKKAETRLKSERVKFQTNIGELKVRWEDKLHEKDHEVNKIKKSMTDLKAHHAESQKRLKHDHHEAVKVVKIEMNKSIKEQAAELRRKEKAIDKLNDKLGSLEDQCEKNKEHARGTERELDGVRNRSKELEGEARQLKTEIDDAIVKGAAAKATLERYLKTTCEQRDLYSKLNDELKASIANEQRTNFVLRSGNEGKEKKIERLQARINELEVQVRVLEYNTSMDISKEPGELVSPGNLEGHSEEIMTEEVDGAVSHSALFVAS